MGIGLDRRTGKHEDLATGPMASEVEDLAPMHALEGYGSDRAALQLTEGKPLHHTAPRATNRRRS